MMVQSTHSMFIHLLSHVFQGVAIAPHTMRANKALHRVVTLVTQGFTEIPIRLLFIHDSVITRG